MAIFCICLVHRTFVSHSLSHPWCSVNVPTECAYFYRKEAAAHPTCRNTRLMKEVASLTTGAPPGVIIRIDESRFDVMRVVIVGAKETPYENGCFVFDVFVPPQYPAVPPLVHFMTTGRATFRFNANLYREGKGMFSTLFHPRL